MTLQITPVPAFDDNYIWMLATIEDMRVAVVDPGDAAPVLAILKKTGQELCDILVTHHHPDHTGGIGELLKAFPHARVLGPHSDKIVTLTQRVSDNENIEVLGYTFKVMAVPGHTLDHIAYFLSRSTNAEQPVVFCGDTLFSAGCGRLREGTPQMLYQSLQKLASLPPETLVYCTHEYTLSNLRFALHVEPDNINCTERQKQCTVLRNNQKATLPSTIALELRTNPFLRCRSEGLSAMIRSQFGLNCASELDIFTHLRRWKDEFQS